MSSHTDITDQPSKRTIEATDCAGAVGVDGVDGHRSLAAQEDRNMSRRGCFTSIVFLLVLVIVALVALMLWLGSEPNGIRTRVEGDRTRLAVGETLALNITIENVSLDAVHLNGVGLDSDLLAGLRLVQTLVDGEPQTLPVKERDYPVIGAWWEYGLDRAVAPGETLAVTFVLEAVTPGSYVGDVTTWVKSTPLGLPLVQARRESLDYAVQ